MIDSKPLLLDTNVLLVLVRGGVHAESLESRFGVRSAAIRPLVSIVTHGEIRSLALRNGWGSARKATLDRALSDLITVDISHPRVIDAYVHLDHFSQSHPIGARNMGKNGLWIAACAMAAGARLLTTDKDFQHIVGSQVHGDVIELSSIGPMSG